MRIVTFSITICLIASTGVIHAQPDSLWTRNYGGNRQDDCCGVVQTADGGFAMAGWSASFGWNFWLIKVDDNGDSLWSNTYGGEEVEGCHALIKTAAGGFALAGYTTSFGAGGEDFWMVVTDEEGEEIWSRTYGGEEDDLCLSIIQNDDGGFMLAGLTNSFGDGRNGWLVKVDGEGEVIWSRVYDDGNDCWISSIISTSDGGFALGGQVDGDFLLVVIDANNESWSQTYDMQWDVWCNSVIQTQNEGFALLGYNMGDFVFAATDNEGDLLWSQSYDRGDWDIGGSVIQTPDGGFSLAGTCDWAWGPIPAAFWLIKTNSEGEIQWTETYDVGGIRTSFGSHLLLEQGSYILAGSFELDFSLVKTDPEPFWIALPDTTLLEDVQLTLDSDYIHEHISTMSLPDSALEISVVDGIHLSCELNEEGLIITPDLNWNGIDYVRLAVSDPNENIDTTNLYLTVHQLNDLPDNFRLLYPGNGYRADSDTLFFVWEQAVQNELEPDEVEYNLFFNADSNEYSITNYPVTTYTDLDIRMLLDSLRIESGEDDISVEWWVTAVDDSGSVECEERFTFNIPSMNIKHGQQVIVPGEYVLLPIYPNPFNSVAHIRFGIPKASSVTISACDIFGRQITLVTEQTWLTGFHSIAWDASRYPAGLYFIRLETAGQVFTQKVILAK